MEKAFTTLIDNYIKDNGFINTIEFLSKYGLTVDEIKSCGFNKKDIDKIINSANYVDDHNIIKCNDGYVYFGNYPQSEVTDSSLKSALTSKAGKLPTSSNKRKFRSYGYYSRSRVSNYMWYIDVEHEGEKYRGVYFTSYRPRYYDYYPSTYTSDQDDNGYKPSNLYWFKYEPIKWRILTEEEGRAMLFADSILDSQQYDCKEDGSYSNNYEGSTIRAWLNNTFYKTAFNTEEQAKILTTVVDNSVASTGYPSNSDACENTNDKIFLLSYQEVTSSAYGFNSDHYINDTAKQKKTTSYAQCQGAYTAIVSYSGNGYWWLRSPCYNSMNNDIYHVRNVYYNGAIGGSNNASRMNFGIVPALRVAL